MHDLTAILISIVAVATLLNVFLKRFNMPTIIGYILTGVIIGAAFDIHVNHNEALEHVAEFGVVFLMFTIGLEFSVSHLKSMKKEVFLFGTLQVALTASVFTALGIFFFNLAWEAAVIVGAALALSSTAIVLKMLNESGKIKTGFGRNSLGTLIFQDIAVIPILLFITIITEEGTSISDHLTSTAINAVIALGLLIGIGRFLLKPFFKMISAVNSKEIYMGSILLTVVGASFIANHFGFSYSLGGFIAGMMIADTIYKYQVEADLIPFRDLLLGVFFVSIGLQIDIDIVAENIISVFGIGLGVMLLKITCIFGIFLKTYGKKVALKTAMSLSQVGEFSLVVFSLIIANKMMDPEGVQILMVIAVVSMITTPFLINNIDKLAGLVFKGKVEEEALDQASIIVGHVILCGYGAFGRVVSKQLELSNINQIIVTNNTESFVKAKEAGKTAVFGDPSDRALLERLGVEDAMNVILALDDFDEVKQASAAITLINPEIKVIAKVPTEEEKDELSEFHHELLLDGNSYTASVLVERINRSRLLAKETSTLKYLKNYSISNPKQAIKKVEKEQARLLDIVSKSFNALRQEKGIMNVKAFHDSFQVLSEIIGEAISNLMENAKLSSVEYERINTLLNNQRQLIAMNTVLVALGKELISLEKINKTKSLSHMAIEGLDAILLSLKDIANDYSQENILILQNITSPDGGGLSKIRESYLGAEADLDSSAKAILVSTTNHIDQLKSYFSFIGKNYKKLYEESSK